MSRNINRCIEPRIYTSADVPGTSWEEDRAILLFRYSERDVSPELQSLVQEHLSRCAGCAELLKKLSEVEQSDTFGQKIIDASCPSSLNLDRFVFPRNELSEEEQKSIETHLQVCSLCKEEMEWLKKTEALPAIPFSPKSGNNWVQYGAIAAALFFLVLSLFLFLERISVRKTEAELQSAAVIKAPEQIDYGALTRASVLLPEKMNGVYERGVEALKQRRFQEAIRHFELVATAHPDHSGALFLAGYSYYQMNEPDRAFQLCDRAEKMAPHSLERCLTLVNIALKTGHYRRALEEISGLHHAAPDHPEIKQTYDRITAISRGRTLRL